MVRKHSSSKKLRRVQALSRHCRHKSQRQSGTECRVRANRFHVATRFNRPCLPCPKLRLRFYGNVSVASLMESQQPVSPQLRQSSQCRRFVLSQLSTPSRVKVDEALEQLGRIGDFAAIG